ncbi:CoA-binding protein [bacterium]|nr:CoA-binding protein [bacterium]
MEDNITEFLSLRDFAVFGASDQRDQAGYRLVRSLGQSGYHVYPINPRIASIGAMRCYGTLDELPVVPQVLVIALPPESAYEVVKSGMAHGVRRFWIQPESRSADLLTLIDENGLAAVHSECLLSELSKRL